MVIPAHIQILLLEKMADIEYRLSTTANERIQLSGLISAFQMARELIGREVSAGNLNGNDHDDEAMEV